MLLYCHTYIALELKVGSNRSVKLQVQRMLVVLKRGDGWGGSLWLLVQLRDFHQ